MARVHIIRYAFKSTQATVQLLGATALGLLAVLLLFSTVWRWRYESSLRDGIQFMATGEGDALPLLAEARKARPDQLLPHLYLGQFQLSRGVRIAQEDELKNPASPDYKNAKLAFEESARAFETAIELRDKNNLAASDSGPVGACCAHLALADVNPGSRAKEIEDAAKCLDEARDTSDVNVLLARAAIFWAKGEVAACSKALGDASTRLGDAGYGALGSYYWHKGLIELMNEDQASFDDLRRASWFRAGHRCGKVISLAVSVLVLSPSCAPKDPKDLEARLTSLEFILSGRTKAGNRYEFDKPDEAAAWNSLGIAWLKIPDAGDHAGQCFQHAISAQPIMLYRLNKALAIRYEAAHQNETKEAASKRLDLTASREIIAELMRFDGEKESEQTKARYRDLMLVGLALGFNASPQGFDYPSTLQSARTKLGLDDAEYYRDMGCCQDILHAPTQMIGMYKKAIDLGHRDRGKMQERVDLFDRKP
jgi:hypothetical protein